MLDEIRRVFQEVDATYHGMQYSYNSNGYLDEVVEATDTNLSYYDIDATDAWGNVTSMALGNGLTSQYTYYDATGLPESDRVIHPLSQVIQDNQ